MGFFQEIKDRVVKNVRENDASVRPDETDEEILDTLYNSVGVEEIIREYGDDMSTWSQEIKDVYIFLVNENFERTFGTM